MFIDYATSTKTQFSVFKFINPSIQQLSAPNVNYSNNTFQSSLDSSNIWLHNLASILVPNLKIKTFTLKVLI